MATNWVICHREDIVGTVQELYEVEYAGSDRVIVKTGAGKLNSLYYSDVDFITEEQALLWKLENQ
jgi:hypothetical protein